MEVSSTVMSSGYTGSGHCWSWYTDHTTVGLSISNIVK